jgi:hypothetical protein
MLAVAFVLLLTGSVLVLRAVLAADGRDPEPAVPATEHPRVAHEHRRAA